MAASSAYKEVRNLAESSGNGERTPCSVAKSRMCWSGSITKMNSMGESGLPDAPLVYAEKNLLAGCLGGLQSLLFGTEERSTHAISDQNHVLVVLLGDSSSWWCQKPCGCPAWGRGMEFLLCVSCEQYFACIGNYLGCISFLWRHCCRPKPSHSSGEQGGLPTAWRKFLQHYVWGLSAYSLALGILGMRTIWAEFRRSKLLAFMVHSWLNAAVKSSLMISQHSLKKRPV